MLYMHFSSLLEVSFYCNLFVAEHRKENVGSSHVQHTDRPTAGSSQSCTVPITSTQCKTLPQSPTGEQSDVEHTEHKAGSSHRAVADTRTTPRKR